MLATKKGCREDTPQLGLLILLFGIQDSVDAC